MVAVILDFLLLRPHQKFAAEWSRVSKIFDAERETAARFILFSFKMNRYGARARVLCCEYVCVCVWRG